MKDIAHWIERLDSEGVSEELKNEFAKTVGDIVYAMAISEEKTDVDSLFSIIDLFGVDDEDSERLRRYLYYCLGDITCSESYAYALAISDIDLKQGEEIIKNALNYV